MNTMARYFIIVGLILNSAHSIGTAEVILKECGGRPRLTMHEEVTVIADGFDRNIAGKLE